MSDERKKWDVASGASVGLVVGLIYVLSLGPVCWITSRTNFGTSTVSTAYRPLTWIMPCPEIGDALIWYSELFARPGWTWLNLQDVGWTWTPLSVLVRGAKTL